jgi:hypothetical protein
MIQLKDNLVNMSSMDIRLLSRNNGVGLTRDLAILARTLRSGGGEVEQVGFHGRGLRQLLSEGCLWLNRGISGQVPVQIFSERIYPRCLPLGHSNLLLPNPEWMRREWMPLLSRFDAVLCKTWHAERIFRTLGCRTRYVGFTSEDRHDPAVPRQRAFFHLAGHSAAKGTKVLLETWQRHPEWPLLTVVQCARKAGVPVRAANIDHRSGYVDDISLRQLQNAHAFHLCPSETEGFGHYLMEAMSVGAITLTTAAEPMNELVTAQRGILIPPVSSHCTDLVSRYCVASQGIEMAVESALALSATQQQALAHSAREFYLSNHAAFVSRLRDAVYAYLPHMSAPDGVGVNGVAHS